jgi:hypothetical protein
VSWRFATSKSQISTSDRLPTRDDVVGAYRVLLGRVPESDAVIEQHLSVPTLLLLFVNICTSLEFRQRKNNWSMEEGSSPFFHYTASFDVRQTIERHVYDARTPMSDHLVNFLGVAIDTSFIPHLAFRGGELEAVPIPCNCHADMAEWAAALRAVELAAHTFCMVELGCGWGCWMNNTGVVAKRKGLKTHVIGIEGDDLHIGFARRALATNGILPSEYTLLRGIASARSGTALFPKQDTAGTKWGQEPIFNATKKQIDDAVASGTFDVLPIVSLTQAAAGREIVDLLHLDIQGGEADLIRDDLMLLTQRVAYLVIGTHSREIEGRLISDLTSAGWILEIERPAIMNLSPQGFETIVDGLQGWRNPKVRPL